MQFEKPSGIDFEIIIGDGRSNDKTVLIIKNFQKVHKNITLFDNPRRYQSFAMNIALKFSKGFYILRLDAHSKYPKDYLKLCYESLNKNDADNAGGIFCTMPGSKTFLVKLFKPYQLINLVWVMRVLELKKLKVKLILLLVL